MPSPSSDQPRSGRQVDPVALWLSWSAFLVLGGVGVAGRPAQALPQGASVRGGQIELSSSQANELLIRQSSSRAAVDFKRFDIGAQEQVILRQPDGRSLFLGRVVGGLGPSQIDGLLKANGGVILINPQGLVIGPGGRVQAGSFVATTLDANPARFMAGGRIELQAAAGAPAVARIVNQGTISVEQAGLVALVAPQVLNQGLISTQLGEVLLAGGRAATIDVTGDGFLKVAITEGQSGSLVDQSGRIVAPGSRVLLGASQIGKVLSSVVNVGGVVEANSLADLTGGGESTPGEVVIAGDHMSVTGTVNAMGVGAQHLGGRIDVLGREIALSGGRLDVSGGAGGGAIRIGGDQRGENAAVPNAQQVLLDAASAVVADATANGNGGRVIVWSDERTEVHGTISARGGPEGGDGGFVETSSAKVLHVSGRVSTAAPKGQAGQWLLDPEEVEISTEAEAGVTDASSSPEEASANADGSAGEGEGETSTISAESLQEAINEGSTVTVEAKGDIAGEERVAANAESGGSLSTKANQVSTAESGGASATSETTSTVGAAPAASSDQGDKQEEAAEQIKEAAAQSDQAEQTPLAAATAAVSREQSAAITAPSAEPASLTPEPQTTRLYLDGVDLSLNQTLAASYAGQNLVIEACSSSCRFTTAGNIFLDALSGLSSLEILAPTRIELKGDISVAKRLTFQGDLFLAAPSITLSSSSLEIAKPIQVASGLSEAPNLQITPSNAAQGIQVGTPTQPVESQVAPLQLQGDTLSHLNQAPVAQLTIGDAAHQGGITVSGALSSPKQLQLTTAGAVQVDPKAVLQASQRVGIEGAAVTVAGSVGATDGLRGGEITIVGNSVTATETARISAIGEQGGGLIQLGGSWQNSNPNVRQATNTAVAAGALLDASATRIGDGGSVVAWATDTTRFGGTIQVRGGEFGGHGGRAETSGVNNLFVSDTAWVDALAPSGAVGDWLLDPRTIVVGSSGAGTLAQASDGSDTSTDLTISAATINAAAANVVLSASNSITVNSAISMTNNGVGIEFTGAPTSGQLPTLNLNADVTTKGGTIEVDAAATNLGAAVSLSTGSSGAGDILFNGTLNGAQTLTLTSGTGDIRFNGAVGGVTALGAVTINAADDVTQESSFRSQSLSQNVAGTGTYWAKGSLTTTSGALTLNSNTLTLDAALTAATNLTLTQTSGALVLDVASGLNATGNSISIYSNDVSITGAGSFGDSSDQVLIRASGNGSIGLGGTAGGLTLSDAELGAITAGQLTLQTTGSGVISVDGISGANSNNVSTVVLSSAGATRFINNSSLFNALTVNSSSGITVDAAVSTDSGALTLTTGGSGVLDVNANLATLGSLVDLNASGSGGLDLASGASITTTKTGANSGAIDIDSTSAVTIDGDLVTTGANNASGVGYSGGGVTIDVSGNAGITIDGTITTSGGASSQLNSNGGAAGAISLNTYTDSGASPSNTTITLESAVITSAGGASGGGTGTQGAGGAIRFYDAVSLSSGGSTLDTGASSGAISFDSTLNGAQALTLTSGTGGITF
ncbi:MAG: hypothetical protein RLZZ186_278, partial [Cyanobacteriota bacterium]